MAKRYTRINWQNNASTPINPTFLNRMDKGIKDNDDAIGDLALLTTNNKTDLVSAINEQNNNLGNLIFIEGSNNDNLYTILSNAKYNVQYNYGGKTITNGAPVSSIMQTILYKRIFRFAVICYAYNDNKLWLGRLNSSTSSIDWQEI